MAMCGTSIGPGTLSYGCRLDAGHDGPHMAPEVARSVAARQRWEQTGEMPESSVGQPAPGTPHGEGLSPGAPPEGDIAQFQGKPETMAQRMAQTEEQFERDAQRMDAPAGQSVPPQPASSQPLPLSNEEVADGALMAVLSGLIMQGFRGALQEDKVLSMEEMADVAARSIIEAAGAA